MFGLNSIGSLTKGKGYQVKMEADATLSLEGAYNYNIELSRLGIIIRINKVIILLI